MMVVYLSHQTRGIEGGACLPLQTVILDNGDHVSCFALQ